MQGHRLETAATNLELELCEDWRGLGASIILNVVRQKIRFDINLIIDYNNVSLKKV